MKQRMRDGLSQPGHTDEGLFVGWANGQPSKNDEKNCVVMVHDKSRKWYNVPCSYSTGFFCEKKVLLLPKIELVEIGECSADIKIKWKASSQAIGIKHRIEFVDNKNGNAKKYDPIDIIPNKESLINEITLPFATNYTVKIYVCPDECVSSCNSETQFVTDGGLPNAVRDSKVMQLTSESICIVSWKKPKPEIVLFPYQINITYELNHISSHSPMIRELNKNQLFSSNNVSFTFEPSPNRKYTFSIRAQTCSGFGESAKAVGKCSTGVAAPPNISSPILPTFKNEDGTANFSISSINEENGPISCIFIIGVVEPKASRPIEESYNQDRIEKANTNLNMSSPGENAEYIAIVLSRSSVINLTNNDGFISLLLGDNQTTYCNVLGKSQHRQKRAIREFSGNNPSLDKETNYGFFTVTSTPNDNGDVMYKSSKMSMLQNSKQEPRNSELTWIVAVVIGVIVFICLLLLAVLLLRRRQDKAPPETESMPMERIVQSAEPTYANLTMESKELRSDTDIPLQRLEIVYNSMKLNNNAEFEKEFQKLKTDAKGSTHSTDVGSASSIAAKNRYKNILPYDNTRVKLSGNGDVSYINACYIQGFNEPRKFIATQGPLPNTVDDFWRMIVEQRCNVIVMLTKCFEKGKKKCEKYWPEQGETKQYGKVVVHNIAEAVFGSYINRTLRVKNGQKSEEIVQHYQLLKWPDHGVPMTTSSFFRTYSAVSECMERSTGPTVVHCSAGAGRTGTFIAYDYLSAERERLNRVDVYNCVINMRQQRVDMVQNCDQYIFIHKLLLESYLLGITDSGPDSFHATSGYPKEERDINDEFRRLSTVDPMKNKTYGSSFKSGNRNKNILPYERNRVKINPLNDEIDVPYVNASYIESYDDSYAIIAAQGPVSASVENFWRSVFDNDVSIIIMLTDCKENNKEQCVQYWPDGVEKTLQLQNVSVVFDEEHIKNGITCRDLRVSLEGEIKQVMQYQYKGWSVSNCPSDPTGVLDLINIMTDRVRSLNNATVIVHCSDGAGRTGTFCAIVNLIERLKCENKIDVFREAKDLRDSRAGMIQTLDQYKFCYLAVSTYLSSFDLYSNFDGKEEETVYENL
uniref:receptor-type tyrosine-protein phosphatase epsilon-like n=1 Tax=Styela clava TaxID=7725 RepID=UPI00193A59F7|nr:receptor-type tyrosine-protein phosphatase epsilon-like [Styela clava]